MKHVGMWAVAAGLLSAAAPAGATPYQFTITGDYSASFVLDSDPVPGDFYGGQGFVFYDTPGPFPGAVLGIADVYFWNAAIGGGLQIDDFYGGTMLLSTAGAQLYDQGEAAPHFLLGTYDLTDYDGPGQYRLTISDTNAPAAPEAASWAMMVAGFGLTGAAMRRRRVAVTFQSA